MTHGTYIFGTFITSVDIVSVLVVFDHTLYINNFQCSNQNRIILGICRSGV